MGKAADERLQIRFSNSKRKYQAGDVVTGSVLLKVEDPRQNINLVLEMCGKAFVAFNRSKGSGKTQRTESYFASEFYLGKRLVLWPQGSSTTQSLVAGHHEFPFSFTLPADIPSSFQSVPGNLTYYLKAKLEEGNNSAKVKEFFIVVRPLDLNSIRSLKCPTEQEKEKMMCCLCCASGPVSAHVYLPKRGFALGEAIPLRAEITNYSSCRIVKSYFTIEQTAHCHAMGKTEDVYKELKPSTPRPEHPEIRPGGTERWTGEETLTVPMAVPTGLDGCDIIDLEHELVLTVVTSGVSLNLRVAIDITIGTIPLREEDDRAVDRSAFSYGSGYSTHEGTRYDQEEQFQKHHGQDMWDSRGYITSKV